MRLQEFLKLTEAERRSTLSANYYDEGFCYKEEKPWDECSLDEIMYIPECAYYRLGDDDFGLDSEWDVCSYLTTKQNLLDLCGGSERLSRCLFAALDWRQAENVHEEFVQEGIYDEVVLSIYEKAEGFVIGELNSSGSLEDLVGYYDGNELALVELVESKGNRITYYDSTNEREATKAEYLAHFEDYNGDNLFIVPCAIFETREAAQEIIRCLVN